MAKIKTHYVCNNCGYISPKWMGKCPDCNQWNTLEEEIKVDEKKSVSAAHKNISVYSKPVPIVEVSSNTSERIPTGISELDRVLGEGGVVKDSVVLLSAQPGTGKSTILLQVSNNIANKLGTVLYFSGEESESQIKTRAVRLFEGNVNPNILVKSTNSADEIVAIVKDIKPNLIIIDSIQTVTLDEQLPSAAGGVTQVKTCTNAFITLAKTLKIPTFIIGQVKKDGDLAGAKYLEHAVDVVANLEGDKGSQLRLLSCSKNRYGSTDELGVFDMTDKGLISVDNPNELFLTKREMPAVGCALVSISEGSRVFVVEVQSLVTAMSSSFPIRNALGVNRETLRVLSSVLDARTKMKTGNLDITVQATGGIYLRDVAVNLGVTMAIASSYTDKPIPDDTVYIGEIGLTGEIRNVQGINQRLKSIHRYGFKRVFVPKGSFDKKLKLDGLDIVEVSTLQEAIFKTFSEAK